MELDVLLADIVWRSLDNTLFIPEMYQRGGGGGGGGELSHRTQLLRGIQNECSEKLLYILITKAPYSGLLPLLRDGFFVSETLLELWI